MNEWIKPNLSHTIKVNFYETGSIVIQGAKCVLFTEKFFQSLKNEVNQTNVPMKSLEETDTKLAMTEGGVQT